MSFLRPLQPFAALLLLAPCQAQDSPQSPPDPLLKTGAQAPPPTFRLEADATHTPWADIDSPSGSVSRTRLGGRASLSLPAAETLMLSFTAGAGVSDYDFRGETLLAPGTEAPWGTIRTFSLGANAMYRPDPQWTLFGGLNASSNGEDGADFSDTLTWGGSFAAAYSLSEQLTIGLGITAQTRLEDSIFILPFPTIDWVLPFDPQERWRFFIGGARIGPSRAAGAGVSFTPSKELSLTAGLGAFGLGGDFRLSDSGPVSGGVGRDTSFPAILSADWRPTPTVGLSAFVGIALFGELEVLDAGGTKVSSRDVDPAPSFGVGIGFSF